MLEIVGPKDFPGPQSPRGDAFRKNCIHTLRLTPVDGMADAELAVFKQGDEAPAEAEKIGGAHHESLKEMFEVAARTEFGRDFKQLVQLVRLALGRGAKFGVRDGNRAEAGDRRYKRLFLGREASILAGIDEDCPLGAGSAEGRGDQHSRGDQAAERVLIAAYGNCDGFSSRNRALRQIGGKTNGLAVVPSPERIGQLRIFGGHGAEFEGTFAAQKNRDQTRAQEQTKPIRQGLNHRGDVGSSVQSARDLSQNFGSAVLFARSFSQPGGFEQAAQLPGQNGSFGGQVFIKKSFVGIMQKRHCADDFIEDHQRSGHQGSRFELAQCRDSRAGLQVVYEDRPAAAHGFRGDSALLRPQPDADKSLGQLAIGLLADEFVAGVAAPEINTTDLEKLAGGTTEEVDQRTRVGALRGLGGNPQEEASERPRPNWIRRTLPPTASNCLRSSSESHRWPAQDFHDSHK